MWAIHDIETLDENGASNYAEEHIKIKGHDIYFVDFGDAFGYSVLVFHEGRHLHYTNDYALHHHGRTRQELRSMYEQALTRKLFTDEELTKPLSSYDEYNRRDYYLCNLYPMRQDYVSAFYIKGTRPNTDGMTFDPVCYAYFDDRQFVTRHVQMYEQLKARVKELSDNYEYWKEAFLYEMRNHEYGINWQGDYDVISVFAPVAYGEGRSLADYLKQAGFNETQQKAYMDARYQYMSENHE